MLWKYVFQYLNTENCYLHTCTKHFLKFWKEKNWKFEKINKKKKEKKMAKAMVRRRQKKKKKKKPSPQRGERKRERERESLVWKRMLLQLCGRLGGGA